MNVTVGIYNVFIESVLFKDEETAIAVGYRPCGVCMKESIRSGKRRETDSLGGENL